MISEDKRLCGGSPALSGTRLMVSDVVELCKNEGVDEFLKAHNYLENSRVNEALSYCAREKCKSSETGVFCRGCEHDDRYTDCGSEQFWVAAKMLLKE